MADDKPEKGATQEPEKGDETGKGDAGGIKPEVAELMKDPAGIEKVLAALKKANKEAETRRLKADADEKKAMEEQGKFKELAEKAKGENEAMRSTFSKRLIDLHLQREAEAAGAIDADAVIALANRADIKVGDDFAVEGAKEAVEALKTSKAHLFAEKTAPVPPPKSGVPAPRGGFNLKIDGTTSTAAQDAQVGFAAKKK